MKRKLTQRKDLKGWILMLNMAVAGVQMSAYFMAPVFARVLPVISSERECLTVSTLAV